MRMTLDSQVSGFQPTGQDAPVAGDGNATGAVVSALPTPGIEPWHVRGSGIQPNGKVSFTIDEAAVQLTRSGLTQNGEGVLHQAATVTYAFRASAATMPEDTGGFSVFSAAQITAAELALSTWADVADITFVRVGSGTAGPQTFNNNATLLFGNYSTGEDAAAAFAYYPGNANPGSADSDVWVNSTLPENSPPVVGGYGQQVLVHEIGHALGLSHPGDYNAGEGDAPIEYDTSAEYYEDSRQYTDMSYFGGANTAAGFPFFASVPMMDDIAAIQRLYGANMSSRTGDTVYGFNSTADKAWYKASDVDNTDICFCVWDAGGHDTFNFSLYSTDSLIDLRQVHFSSVGGAIGNVSIAQGAVIEDALGGGGNDLMIGNDSDNFLSGGDGRDTLIGGTGADRLDGGLGSDTASYQTAAASVHVDLGAAIASGSDADGDVLTGIENLTGSAHADILSGDNEVNILTGGAGDDVLNGGAGGDTLIGGDGSDTYYVDDQNDSVVETAGALSSGADTLYTLFSTVMPDGIEIAHLTGDNDAYLVATGGIDYSLYGNAGGNAITGGDGNDHIDGGTGADTMTGGGGNDTFYVDNANDIVTELHGGGSDTVVSSRAYALTDEVEKLILTGTASVAGTGNTLNNTLLGNDGNNKLLGGAGNDSLAGGLGRDTLDGGQGADVMKGGQGDDRYYVDSKLDVVTEYSGQGSDTILVHGTYTLGLNIENLTLTGLGDRFGTGNGLANYMTGNRGNNTLGGGEGNDIIDGGPGMDAMRGGQGNDTFYVDNAGDTVAEYTNQGTDSVFSTVNFTLGNNVETLTLTGTANLHGTGNSLANNLIGNSGNNHLDGGKGHDMLTGGLGADTFVFGLSSGDDIITDFSAGDNDTIDLSAWHAQTTAIISQAGSDTVIDLGGGNIVTILNTSFDDPGLMGHIVW